ncbi:MAG TPA: YdeI/OmpD-associated family protein [Nitrososphaerales archaeon]|nr:YdeI/OmpD-associated family protein [Nitrososphaerales archaeon]
MGREVTLLTLDARDAREWHDWLAKHHLDTDGVLLVFHKCGVPSISYGEALDVALAYGWIDSVIRRIDDARDTRKFTPRRPRSIWSKLNVDRVSKLTREGRMTKRGLTAFSQRTSEVSLLERFNAGQIGIPPGFEVALRKNRKAWANYQRMSPSHRRRYFIWISGAKKWETREKHIAEAVQLIARNVKDLLK